MNSDALMSRLQQIRNTLSGLLQTSTFPFYSKSGAPIERNDVVKVLMRPYDNIDLVFPEYKKEVRVFNLSPIWDILSTVSRIGEVVDNLVASDDISVTPWWNQPWTQVVPIVPGERLVLSDVFYIIQDMLTYKCTPEEFLFIDESTQKQLSKTVKDVDSIILYIKANNLSQLKIGRLYDAIFKYLDFVDASIEVFSMPREIICEYIRCRLASVDGNDRKRDSRRIISDMIEYVDAEIRSIDAMCNELVSQEGLGDVIKNIASKIMGTKNTLVVAIKKVVNVSSDAKWRKYMAQEVYSLYDKYKDRAEVLENTVRDDPTIVLTKTVPAELEKYRQTLSDIAQIVTSGLESCAGESNQEEALQKAFASFIDSSEKTYKLDEQIIRGMRRKFCTTLFDQFKPFGYSVEGYVEKGTLPKPNFLLAYHFVTNPEEVVKPIPVSSVIRSAASFEIMRKNSSEAIIGEIQKGIKLTESLIHYGDMKRMQQETKISMTTNAVDKQTIVAAKKIVSVGDQLVRELESMEKYIIDLHILLPNFHSRIISLFYAIFNSLIGEFKKDLQEGVVNANVVKRNLHN